MWKVESHQAGTLSLLPGGGPACPLPTPNSLGGMLLLIIHLGCSYLSPALRATLCASTAFS